MLLQPRRLGIVVAVLAIGVLLATTSSATASPPARASLPTIERRVMCVTCKIPLIVAQSPQANSERTYIRGLIAAGLTEPQIERAMVSQYGPTVLGLPSAHGFDLTVYLVPLAAVLALVATLALLLPRWRRRARAQESESESAWGATSDGDASSAISAGTPELTSADAARLDADLAKFDR